MSHLALSPNCAFGLRSAICHGAYFLEEGSLVFPVGHSVVLHHLETRTQRFIQGLPESDGISAVALSSTRRHLALAERSDNAPVIVYDLQTLKRRKVLVSVDPGKKEIVCLCFGQDGKLLATQSGAPDWTLTLWAWEKTKLLATVKIGAATAVHKVRRQRPHPFRRLCECMFVPPTDGSLCVVGPRLFKQFRLTESSLKQQPHFLTKSENDAYCCAEWRNDDLLVGCANGRLFCCEGSDVAWSHHFEHAAAVESIVKTSNGFVVGTGVGEVVLFETHAKERYLPSKTVSLHSAAVTHLVSSPNQEQLLAATTDGQMFLASLATMEMSGEVRSFDPAFTPFHNGAILGLGTCVRKQLVATSGVDKTLRFWNYFSKTTELVKTFAETCFSVGLHPSGTLVVAGFADKLRLMTVLMDDLKLVKEFPLRGCRECRFSNGGQYFAAAGGNTVFVYATYTCDNVATLRGHTGKVSSLFWSRDDGRLLSSGLDGAVYEWDVKAQRRERENVLKGCNYTCVVATSDFNNVLAVGSDMKIKELEDIQGSGLQITKDVAAPLQLTQLALPSSTATLFSGSRRQSCV